MRVLEAVIDALAAEDLNAVDDAALAAEVVAGERSIARLQAEHARRIAEFDRRELAARDGASSTAAWLRWRTRCALGVAHARVRTARRLEELPATRRGLAAGAFGWEQAAAIAGAMTAPRAEFAGEGDVILARAAGEVDAGALRNVIRHWIHAADDAAAVDEANAAHADRRAWLGTTMDGVGVLRAVTDAEGAETLAAALHAAAKAARRPGDGLTAAQRRHDALIQLARCYLDHGDRLATVSGARPHVLVRVDLPTLQDVPGVATAELDWAGAICAATARRLACDSAVVRVLTRGGSQPLDIGRASEVVPVGLRRAVITRDRACTFAGCDRHARYCDAHHVRHWADGGPTSLDNLALLCRFHHRLVHEGGWQIGRDPAGGGWVTTPPGETPPAGSVTAQPPAQPALCAHIQHGRDTVHGDRDLCERSPGRGQSAPMLAREPRPAYSAVRSTARLVGRPPPPAKPSSRLAAPVAGAPRCPPPSRRTFRHPAYRRLCHPSPGCVHRPVTWRRRLAGGPAG